MDPEVSSNTLDKLLLRFTDTQFMDNFENIKLIITMIKDKKKYLLISRRLLFFITHLGLLLKRLINIEVLRALRKNRCLESKDAQ